MPRPQMLQAYCSQLEHRVIERFDAAVEAGDEREQAECVRIMIQCDKERTIAQVRFGWRVWVCLGCACVRWVCSI